MYASFPHELNTVFDAGLAKYGPVELAKRFMFYYMRENGVTYGDAWQCVIELSESSFKDPIYIRKVEQFYAKLRGNRRQRFSSYRRKEHQVQGKT